MLIIEVKSYTCIVRRSRLVSRVTFDLTGEKEVLKALKNYPDQVNKVMKPIYLAGAKIYRDDARKRAVKRTRNLAEHIVTEVLKEKDGFIVIGVGPKNKEAFYAIWVEFGTAPHSTRASQAKALEIQDGQVFRVQVSSRGTAPQPFMRPAFDKNTAKVVQSIADDLAEILDL